MVESHTADLSIIHTHTAIAVLLLSRWRRVCDAGQSPSPEMEPTHAVTLPLFSHVCMNTVRCSAPNAACAVQFDSSALSRFNEIVKSLELTDVCKDQRHRKHRRSNNTDRADNSVGNITCEIKVLL